LVSLYLLYLSCGLSNNFYTVIKSQIFCVSSSLYMLQFLNIICKWYLALHIMLTSQLLSNKQSLIYKRKLTSYIHTHTCSTLVM
jgi:hypothetical protein